MKKVSSVMSISKVEIYLFHSFDTQSMIACGLNALILGKGQFFKEDFITSKMLNKRVNPNPRLCAQ